MTSIPTTLSEAALTVLACSDPWKKAELTQLFLKDLGTEPLRPIGTGEPCKRPARPEKPELRHPNDMPKRRKAGSKANKIALLHALAHIELNAIDLAWDIIVRFSTLAESNGATEGLTLPDAFYADWAQVAKDEAKHFLMLSDRLKELDADYGDLPAHDGLWEAAEVTAHDLAARLAIVPMVLEARGLDVTPQMITAMKKGEDFKTAEILQIIHDEEITHVKAGSVWFQHWCDYNGKTIDEAWKELVIEYFRGTLKRPFNDVSREKAGLLRHWYEPLADELLALRGKGFDQ